MHPTHKEFHKYVSATIKAIIKITIQVIGHANNAEFNPHCAAVAAIVCPECNISAAPAIPCAIDNIPKSPLAIIETILNPT